MVFHFWIQHGTFKMALDMALTCTVPQINSALKSWIAVGHHAMVGEFINTITSITNIFLITSLLGNKEKLLIKRMTEINV